jgi:mannose-1-phosphate guanylyltransferase
MLQDTVNRISPLVPQRDIFIVTNKNYLHKIKAQVPGIPAENLIAEPYPLGTALAIGLMAIKIKKINPEEIMVVLWSDNYIKNKTEFVKVLKLAKKVAGEGYPVVIGVNPTHPSTAYGYIQLDRELKEFGPTKVFLVKKFIEKPTLARAKKFLESWDYLWNSGISILRVDSFLDLFARYLPDHFAALQTVEKVLDSEKETKTIERIFVDLEKIPIDTAIWEKIKNLAVIPADLGWSDIGSWSILKEVLKNNYGTNVVVKGKFCGLDSQNCLVYGGERLITAIGLENMAIIDTDDAVLICPMDQAQKVKDLVNKLRKEGRGEYL